MMETNVSIIIVNYNTKELLEQCINSIYTHTKDISFEIIIVDNASVDGSQQMIKNNYPHVVLIGSKENLGFGRANNIGVKHASGNYILLLNSDTILIENSIKVLVEYIENENDSSLGVVGCKLLDIHQKPDVSYGHFPTIYQELFEFGLSRIFRRFYSRNLSLSIIGNGEQIKEVDYIMGAAMFFKKSIFDSINGFDNDFFLYYEETELCFRLKRKGYRVIWNPNTSIIHYIGASGKSQDKINYWILEQLHRSKFIYYKKCHGMLMATAIKYLTVPKALIIYRKFDTARILKAILKTA